MDPDPADLTSLHVRRAIDGVPASLEWLVEHLSPALHMQARYRLRGPVANFCEPADLVQDVWAIALPRLTDLVARDGRYTPVLVKFLSTTLLQRLNGILKARLRGERSSGLGGTAGDEEQALPDPMAASAHGVSASIDRRELRQTVGEAIATLDAKDQEVVVLRGIEQLSNNKVAEVLGVRASTVTVRYQKALLKLRSALPDSVFGELSD